MAQLQPQLVLLFVVVFIGVLIICVAILGDLIFFVVVLIVLFLCVLFSLYGGKLLWSPNLVKLWFFFFQRKLLGRRVSNLSFTFLLSLSSLLLFIFLSLFSLPQP